MVHGAKINKAEISIKAKQEVASMDVNANDLIISLHRTLIEIGTNIKIPEI
jgi:hypothetical protein